MLTEKDREMVERLLTESGKALEEALAGTSDECCAVRPAPGAWSPLEIVEHVVIVESFNQHRLGKPGTPGGSTADDSQIFRMVSGGEAKLKSPERVCPKGCFSSRDEALEAFRKCRAETLSLARTTELPLREYVWPHPMLGPLDGVQWLIFLAAHSNRHACQVRA